MRENVCPTTGCVNTQTQLKEPCSPEGRVPKTSSSSSSLWMATRLPPDLTPPSSPWRSSQLACNATSSCKGGNRITSLDNRYWRWTPFPAAIRRFREGKEAIRGLSGSLPRAITTQGAARQQLMASGGVDVVTACFDSLELGKKKGS